MEKGGRAGAAWLWGTPLPGYQVPKAKAAEVACWLQPVLVNGPWEDGGNVAGLAHRLTER